MYFSPKTSADGLVFHYDTGNTIRSYLGEPTTNLAGTDAARTIGFHNQEAYGNAGSVSDAPEKGPGWKKITITNRGNNFRIAQFPYTSLTGGVTYTYSLEVDMGATSGYFWRIDGTGGYSAITIVNNRVVTTITPSVGSYAIFLNHNTTGVSGISEVIYYRYYQVEQNSHSTQFTTGTRSATQGLKDLTAANTIDLSNVSFDANAQMTFDGTDDRIDIGDLGTIGSTYSIECVFKSTSVTSYRNVFDMNYATYSGVTGNTGPRLEQTTGQGINIIWSGVTNNNNLYNNTNLFAISANIYYHVAFVQNGTTGAMYVNGILRDQANNAQGYLQTFGDFNIGRGFVLDPSRYFSGNVDMFKIFNRALTADEVARNFNAIKSRFNIG